MNKFLSALIFIGAWQLLGQVTDSTFLVSFSTALMTLGDLFLHHHLILDVWVSFRRIFIALVLTFAVAIPLGIWIGRSPFAQDISKPLTHFLRYIPAPTLIPLSILWLGVQEESKIFIVFWGILFTSLLGIRDAALNVNPDLIQAAHSMGFTAWQKLRHIVFPSILPEILNIIRISWGESWIYLLIGEMIAADNGIGKSLIVAQRFLRVDQIFALLLLLGIMGFVSDIFFKKFYHYAFPYKKII